MDAQADVGPLEDDGQTHEAGTQTIGPPNATLRRRSQSYSDFHDAVRAVLWPGGGLIKASNASKCEEEIENELDFGDWYHGLEHDLLNASHGDYQSVKPFMLATTQSRPTMAK